MSITLEYKMSAEEQILFNVLRTLYELNYKNTMIYLIFNILVNLNDFEMIVLN